MTSSSEQLKAASAPAEGPRSIRDIIADLSKPVNPKRLKRRQLRRAAAKFGLCLNLYDK